MSNYNVVTIERQFASGGRQVGRLLADRLGVSFYNEEILQMTADKLQLSEEQVRQAEERVSSSFMYALSVMANGGGMPVDFQLADKVFYTECEIIKNLARHEKCVIVGRCAGHVLGDRKDCLTVFIHAEEDVRIKRAVEDYGIPSKDALSVLRKNDKRRTEFYNAQSAKRWAAMDTYNICLDSGTLGIPGCADMIAAAIQVG